MGNGKKSEIIVLDGMIGVGKSTYTGMLMEHLGYEAFYEPVEENPFLEKFYEDPKRWAFSLQIYFLNSRFSAIKEALKTGGYLMDRSIYLDELFAYINYKQGNMTLMEFEVYKDLLHNMMEELNEFERKAPGLFIYLRASFDTALARMKKRNREFELASEDTIEYFKLLHSHYDDFVFNRYAASEVLVIDADKYDVTIESDRAEVLAIVDAKFEELGIPRK